MSVFEQLTSLQGHGGTRKIEGKEGGDSVEGLEFKEFLPKILVRNPI